MNKRSILGAALFVSIAANIGLGSALLGRAVPAQWKPIEIVMERLSTLNEVERAKAEAIFEKERPALQAAVDRFTQARIDVYRHIKSDAYKREEAERLFAILRDETTKAQIIGQTMVLDLTENMPLDQRNIFLRPMQNDH